jgi:leader peptidase (prepilin peptidase)/N-methyltransferase
VRDYIFGAIIGLAAGFAFNRLGIRQISKRTEDVNKQNALKKPAVIIAWLIISSIVFAAVIWRDKDILTRIEYLVYISVILNIAAVDYLIRKIPNELLLVMLAVKMVFLVIALVKTPKDFVDILFMPAVGLVIASVVFSVPSMLHISMGAGDVKFAGVIGFCFGYLMFLQSMVIMAVILLFYLLYLLVTRKGNLKTAIAMGPYLAVGVVLTMLFPISGFLPK